MHLFFEFPNTLRFTLLCMCIAGICAFLTAYLALRFFFHVHQPLLFSPLWITVACAVLWSLLQNKKNMPWGAALLGIACGVLMLLSLLA